MGQFALMAGMSLVQAGLAGFAASQRNSAIESAMRRNNARAAEELNRQAQIDELRTLRLSRNAARAQGLVRVSAAERGVGSTGSTAALATNLAVEQDIEQYGLDLEHYGAERGTLANLQSTQEGLAGQGQSVALAALSGAISGAQTGLAIGQGISDFTAGTPTGLPAGSDNAFRRGNQVFFGPNP